MSERIKTISGRLLRSLIVIAGILVINFSLLNLAPGDAVEILVGESGGADAEYVERLREAYGLNQPLPMQFLNYAKGLLSLDLGWSARNNTSVANLIMSRLPATLLLAGGALIFALAVGILLGVVAARRPNSPTDNVISVVSLLAYAVPTFWLGLMLVVVFSIQLGWFPTGGFRSIDMSYSGFAYYLDVARHSVLPILTLAFFYTAIYARLMRASMLEVAGLDYVRTARAKGLTEGRVQMRHVLRNALLPIATMIGIHLSALLGGSVVVEMVFAWPGLGQLAFNAIMSRDLNVLLGILFLSSVAVVIVNLLMDFVYVALDPRISTK